MHRHDASCFMHTFPLFRSLQRYACHAFLCHPLALCASLLACLHVHAWVLLVSVSSMIQHNEAMDIRSKPTFVPHKHHLLFAILLVYPLLIVCYLACLPLCSYVCLHPVCYACHCYLACLFCAFLLENPMVRSKVMALGSLRCIDRCVIPVFVISRSF